MGVNAGLLGPRAQRVRGDPALFSDRGDCTPRTGVVHPLVVDDHPLRPFLNAGPHFVAMVSILRDQTSRNDTEGASPVPPQTTAAGRRHRSGTGPQPSDV